MSDDAIQLSDELVTDVIDVIVKHEAKADQNLGLSLQYLGAVMGYLSGQFPGSTAQRHEWLEQLNQFIRHVSDEHAAENKPAEAPANDSAAPNIPSGKCEADTDNPAAGVWRVSK